MIGSRDDTPMGVPGEVTLGVGAKLTPFCGAGVAGGAKPTCFMGGGAEAVAVGSVTNGGAVAETAGVAGS